MGGNAAYSTPLALIRARWSRVAVPYGRALEEKDTGMSGVSRLRKGQLLTRFGHSIMVRAQDRLRSHPASGLVSPCARSPAAGAVRVPASPTFIDHGHQQAVRAVISAGAPASQRVRGRLGREPTGRADDVRERPALAHRRRTRRSGSSRTMPHLARSCEPPGARWPPRARWRAATVSCRSSRYARTGRTGAGETTILRWPGTRRSRSRWAAWLGRLLTMCSRWLPS
jgi:hypothetical protein